MIRGFGTWGRTDVGQREMVVDARGICVCVRTVSYYVSKLLSRPTQVKDRGCIKQIQDIHTRTLFVYKRSQKKNPLYLKIYINY